MSLYLFAGFVSCLVHLVLIIPFINFLYKLKLQRAQQKTRDAFNNPTPIFDKFHHHKRGTPVGGGILITLLTTLLFCYFLAYFTFIGKPLTTNYPSFLAEIKIILFTFLSFAFLGVYDDLSKIFFWKKSGFFGLKLRMKLIIEIVLALIISFWLFSDLKIDFIYIPFMGVHNLSIFYILFAAFVIVSFANAVNITDGLDGLATGVLMIAVTGFWIVARNMIDVPTSIFIAVWLGGLVAFLYFNIFPARIFLGDTGALSFGATFAVIGLILGKAFALPIIGGIFVIEIVTSLIQLLGKKFLKRKLLPVAPLHLLLQTHGWEEPKIVMRFWVLSIIFALFGLMIAFM
jgi:phospho-N-acetylmuramoyl-pentapeptide-transferase